MATPSPGDQHPDRASDEALDPDQLEQQTPVARDPDGDEWEPVNEDGPVSADVVEQHQIVDLDPDEGPAD